jgi:predicted phage terminase large subunit-like protein
VANLRTAVEEKFPPPPPPPDPDTLAAEASLEAFVRQAWDVLEPGVPLSWGWHMTVLCEHLEALYRGDILNLYVAIPPGSTKSTIAGVMFPAWWWVRDARTRFLCAANTGDLATRDSVACRRLIESDWYQERWGRRYRLTTDQNVKTWYENSRRGFRTATTVGSKVTGKKGHVLILDDPHDAKEVESPTKRQAVIDWWNQSFYNRVINPRDGRRLVIGQRTHVGDLPAEILKQGKFVELRIPEEFEAEHCCVTPLGRADHRTEEGEFLRPDRFGPEQKAEALQTLGTVGYAAQHQQRPTPREGVLFKAAWFEKRFHLAADHVIVDGLVIPFDHCTVFAVMDPAGGESDSANYTAIGVYALAPGNRLLLLRMVRERLPLERIVPRLAEVCAESRCEFAAVEVGFLQGRLARQAEQTPGMCPVKTVEPGGKDKLVRALPAVIRAEAGQVLLPEEAEWLGDFELELFQFTGQNDAHDDQVDTVSYAVQLVEEVSLGADSGYAPGHRPRRR